MLALSNSQESNGAIEAAINSARESKNLLVVYVVDVNLAYHFIETDVGFYPQIKERCEDELLNEYVLRAKKRAASIAQMANREGIAVTSYVDTGRFVRKCLEVIQSEKPDLVITTRSRRPRWIRRLFGSSTDYLITHSGCRVIEA